MRVDCAVEAPTATEATGWKTGNAVGKEAMVYRKQKRELDDMCEAQCHQNFLSAKKHAWVRFLILLAPGRLISLCAVRVREKKIANFT